MPSDVPALLRLLGKVAAVVVLGALVGAGLGFALSKLSGTEAADITPVAGTSVASGPTGPPDNPLAASSGPSISEETDAGTSATGGEDFDPEAEAQPDLRVVRGTFVPSTSPSGISRRRSRVTIRLEATAKDADVRLESFKLVVGNETRSADPNAREVAGGLLSPIPSGASATGELRFEFAGALTEALRTQRRVTLEVDGRRLPVTLSTE
jgi:hypothetical protein